jgi:hypothetical protein
LAQPAHGSTELASRAQTACVLIEQILHASDYDTPATLSFDLHDITLAQPCLAERSYRDRDLVLSGNPRLAGRASCFLYIYGHE